MVHKQELQRCCRNTEPGHRKRIASPMQIQCNRRSSALRRSWECFQAHSSVCGVHVNCILMLRTTTAGALLTPGTKRRSNANQNVSIAAQGKTSIMAWFQQDKAKRNGRCNAFQALFKCIAMIRRIPWFQAKPIPNTDLAHFCGNRLTSSRKPKSNHGSSAFRAHFNGK